MKNVDKIRKLSNEEIAECILNILDGHCGGCPAGTKCPIDPEWNKKEGCKERILKWLNDEDDWSSYIIPFKENY